MNTRNFIKRLIVGLLGFFGIKAARPPVRIIATMKTGVTVANVNAVMRCTSIPDHVLTHAEIDAAALAVQRVLHEKWNGRA